jgi:hypothetical protein
MQAICPDQSARGLRGGSAFEWINVLVKETGEGIVHHLLERRAVTDFFPVQISWYRRRALLKKIVHRQIFTPIHLALVGEQGRASSEDESHVVVIAHLADVAPLLEEELNRTVDVRIVGYSRPRDFPSAVLVWFFYTQVSKCIRRIVGLLRGQRRRDSANPSTVAVQHTVGVDGPTAQSNNLWWLAESGLPPDRCMLFFDHSSHPATDMNISNLEKRGFRRAILKRTANASSSRSDGFPAEPLGRTLRDVMECAKVVLSRSTFVAPRWQITVWLRTTIEMRAWQRLMEAENIRVIIDVGETGKDRTSLAADLVGAIRLGYNRSVLYPLMSRIVRLHHVYFAWGPRDHAIIADENLDGIDVVLQGGCVFEEEDGNVGSGEDSRDPRSQVGLIQAAYVVCAFDRSINGCYGPDRHIEFYDSMISLAESDPAFGLIIKHKGVSPKVFLLCPKLARRANALVEQGRLALIGGTRTVGEAARMSDLVVGMGWNSAAFVAALQGSRTVFWDGADLLGGPAADRVREFNWHDPQIVFTDLERMIEAVGMYLRSPGAVPGFGDLSRVLDRIDPFRDGQATARLGLFIRWFIEAIDAGMPRDVALRRATERYAEEWGADKVSRR